MAGSNMPESNFGASVFFFAFLPPSSSSFAVLGWSSGPGAQSGGGGVRARRSGLAASNRKEVRLNSSEISPVPVKCLHIGTSPTTSHVQGAGGL